MILRFRKVTRYFLFLSDLLLINGSVGLGRYLSSAGIGNDAFLRYALLMNLLWILLVVIRDRYQPVTFVNVSKAAFRLLFTHFLLLVSVIYLFDRQEIPRSFIVLLYMTMALMVLGSRHLTIFI